MRRSTADGLFGPDQTICLPAGTFSESGEAERVASSGVGAIESAARQLDDRKRAPGRGDAPGRHIRTSLEHAPIFRDERHVNRKAHEEGVDSAAGGDDEAAALGEGIVVEEAPPAACRIEGGQHGPRDEPVVPGIDERE
jgi:hypothetical protein